MKIVLKTDLNSLSKQYIETLVLLYLPMEKFGENDSEKKLTFSVQLEDGKYFGSAVYEADGVFEKEELSLDRISNEGFEISAKSFAGKLFISLFGRIFGYFPPWGMLTGVRPARFALDMMNIAKTYEATKALLCNNYLCTPEKADLAIKVAQFDKKIYENKGNRDFSLYIGIPFCPTRCRYCSFVSYSTPSLLSLIPEYVDMLFEETKMLLSTAKELSLDLKSIYVGGGTPTVLDEDLLESFLKRLYPLLEDTNFEEFTFEAGRPDTVTEEKLSILKKYGVTRVSINTQTSNDEILSSVGRKHTYSDFVNAFNMAKKYGFSVNTDLIAGLPGECVESFKKSISDVVKLSPDNITVHSFSLKKSSDYTLEGEKLDPKDEKISEMLMFSSLCMEENGYMPYYMYRQKNTGGNFENVGYTKSEKEAGLYNVYMMEGLHTILAAGAGASTKLVFENLTNNEKIYNPKYPFEYLKDKENILKHGQIIKSFYDNRYYEK